MTTVCYFSRSLTRHSYKNLPLRHPRRQAGITIALPAVILAGRREKIAGSDFSRAKRARRARIRDDTRNVAATTVTRTTTVEINNWIAGTSR